MMNELERHAAGAGERAGSPADATRSAKETIGSATETAKDALAKARRSAERAYGDSTSSVRETYRSASRKTADISRKLPNSAGEARRAIGDYVEDNPIMVGVIGIAAGLILGAVLPGTRRENQVFGRYADDVKDQGLRYARDLAEQGRHFVEESLDSVSAAAHQEG